MGDEWYCLRSVQNLLTNTDVRTRSIPFPNTDVHLVIHERDKLCSFIYAEIGEETMLIEPGDKLHINEVGPICCRGELSFRELDLIDERIIISEHKPCMEPVKGKLPFCDEHRNTFHARYMAAVMYGTKLSEDENRLAGPHMLYITFPPRKVGVTKQTRYLKRASEQPHALFIPLAKFLSVNEAILLERKIRNEFKQWDIKDRLRSVRKWAYVRDSLRYSVNSTELNLLLAVKNYVHKQLKGENVRALYDHNIVDAYRVCVDMKVLKEARPQGVSSLRGTYVFLDFIAGFLLLMDIKRNRCIAVDWSEIIDRKIKGVIKT